MVFSYGIFPAVFSLRYFLAVIFPRYFFHSRHAGGGFDHSDEKRPRVTQARPATAATRLHAKATYKNFEDMLEKEPGALLVDFYAT